MSEQEGKNRMFGIVGSVLFHAAIIAILFLTKLQTIESNEGGGILVAYGGNYEIVTQTSTNYSPPKVVSSADEITQDSDEPTISTDEEKRKREEAERAEAERKAKEEQLRLEQERINSLVSGALSTANNGADAQGKGSPDGTSATGADSGNAGYGTFDLGGRGLRTGESLPRPSYDNSNDEGTITIRITVNPSGKVISAQASPIGSKGGAYNNSTLRARAVESARKALFEPSKDKNNQQGTITYHFKQR